MPDLSPRAFTLLRGLNTAVGGAFTALVVWYGFSRPDGEWRGFWLLYVLPIVAAAPLWLHIRLEAPARWPWATRVLDAAVVALAVIRFFRPVYFPFSGHALFLTYAMMTTRRRWWLVVAGTLLVETTIFKLALWDDPGSLATGAALGLLASLFYFAFAPR